MSQDRSILEQAAERDVLSNMQCDTPLPWQRARDETAKAYAAFCHYRDMGPVRSLRLLLARYEEEHCQQTANEPPTGNRRVVVPTLRFRTLADWSRRNEWQRRAGAYDAHLALVARRVAEVAYMEDLESFKKRQKELSQATYAVAVALLDKARVRLEALDVEEIGPGRLPSYFRAAASIAESATNAEAVALGVHELIELLDAQSET